MIRVQSGGNGIVNKRRLQSRAEPAGMGDFRVGPALPRGRGNVIMNGAGQEIGPVAFEEWLVVTVQTSDGARLAGEDSSVEPDMNLLRPILGSLGHEADVLKFADAGFGHAIPLRSADRSRSAAAAATLDVERKRRQHRFR